MTSPVDLIYVGYPKTGTTTVQMGLFDRHPEIDYLGKITSDRGGPYLDTRMKTLIDELLHADDFDYDATALRRHVVDNHDRVHRITVWGEEGITSLRTIGAGLVAQRLHRCFPEAKVLFTIREQRKALESWYVSTARLLTGAPKPYDQRHITFENWLQHSAETYPRGAFGALDYWRTIEFYRNLFGSDRVEVLLFEDLVDDTRSFARGIGEILDLDSDECLTLLEGEHHNVRQGGRLLRYQLLREKVLPDVPLSKVLPGGTGIREKVLNLLRGGKGLDVTLPAGWAAKVERLCAEGNRLIMSNYALPLDRYGYALPGSDAKHI